MEYLTSGSIAPRPRQTVVSLAADLPGSVEMVWDWLIQAPTATAWFPLRGPLTGDEVAFQAGNGEEPEEWTVTDLVVDSREHALTFRLAHRDWIHRTSCRLDLQPREDCALLTVAHSGWDAIVPDTEARWRARREFAVLWHKAVLFVTLAYVRTLHIPTISPEELQTRLNEPDVFLYDTNRITLWRQGHIAGAVHVGQEDIASDVLPADRQASLIFYCRDDR
jgi:hypothetical protein